MSVPFINIHSHQLNSNTTSISVFSYSNHYDIDLNNYHGPISIGIHPWYINQTNISSQISNLKSLLKQKNVIAIGECGIDKLIEMKISIQQEVFEIQIQLAAEFKKPIIIHCVKSHEIIINSLKKYNFKLPVIFHGFNNKIETAQKILESGYLISLGKALLSTGSNAQRIVKSLPINNLFLETDDSLESIETIYAKAAELKEIDIEPLKIKMYSNFKKAFSYE